MKFLEQNEIQIYSIKSDLKAVFVERFNRTLLDLIKKPMYIEDKDCWLNHHDTAMDKYNNRVHGTTKMTSFEMSTNNKLIANNNNYTAKLASHNLPKVQFGDYVRVPDKRTLYSKDYTTNWNGELFKLQNFNKKNLVTYDLDGNNELIEGKDYEQEFLRSVFNFESDNKT